MPNKELEKVDPKEFVSGFMRPASYWKSLGIGLKLGMILLIGYSIYFTIFAKKPTQTQTFVVQPGASVTVQQNQQTAKKKWWIPAPFVDVYTFAETNDEKGMGVRFGGRWEW